MQRSVRKPCEILVYYDHRSKSVVSNSKSCLDFENQISQAYGQLLDTGLYSDLEIIVNGETIKAHKCILKARSEKFQVMLYSSNYESMQSHFDIERDQKNDVKMDTVSDE